MHVELACCVRCVTNNRAKKPKGRSQDNKNLALQPDSSCNTWLESLPWPCSYLSGSRGQDCFKAQVMLRAGNVPYTKEHYT